MYTQTERIHRRYTPDASYPFKGTHPKPTLVFRLGSQLKTLMGNPMLRHVFKRTKYDMSGLIATVVFYVCALIRMDAWMIQGGKGLSGHELTCQGRKIMYPANIFLIDTNKFKEKHPYPLRDGVVFSSKQQLCSSLIYRGKFRNRDVL